MKGIRRNTRQVRYVSIEERAAGRIDGVVGNAIDTARMRGHQVPLEEGRPESVIDVHGGGWIVALPPRPEFSLWRRRRLRRQYEGNKNRYHGRSHVDTVDI